MLAAECKDGPTDQAHGKRGRRPQNFTDAADTGAVVQLATERCEVTNHTHLTELLSEEVAARTIPSPADSGSRNT